MVSDKSESLYCHAQVPVTDDRGWHLCDRKPGHDGAHHCDVCDVEWRDGVASAPVKLASSREQA